MFFFSIFSRLSERQIPVLGVMFHSFVLTIPHFREASVSGSCLAGPS